MEQPEKIVEPNEMPFGLPRDTEWTKVNLENTKVGDIIWKGIQCENCLSKTFQTFVPFKVITIDKSSDDTYYSGGFKPFDNCKIKLRRIDGLEYELKPNNVINLKITQYNTYPSGKYRESELDDNPISLVNDNNLYVITYIPGETEQPKDGGSRRRRRRNNKSRQVRKQKRDKRRRTFRK